MELIKRYDLSEGKTNKEKHVKPREENPLKEKHIQLISMQIFYHKESDNENCTKTLQKNEFNSYNQSTQKNLLFVRRLVFCWVSLWFTQQNEQ